MDKAYPLNAPMVVWTLDIQKDPFHPLGEEEVILGLKPMLLSAIGALMYFANNTKPVIHFIVNLLARYNFTLTRRHWKGVKVCYVIYGKLYIWVYFIHRSHYPIPRVLLIPDTCLILTKDDHKFDTYSLIIVRLSHGILQSKILQLLHQIMLKS